MSMNYTVREVKDVTILDLSGRISLGEAQAFGSDSAMVLHELVQDFVNKGSRKILLNLRQVTYIDSSGLGELVSCMTTLQSQGGQLRVCNPVDHVRDLLRMTHLDSVLQFDKDEATSLQALAQKKASAA